jgi:hypothetical protein
MMFMYKIATAAAAARSLAVAEEAERTASPQHLKLEVVTWYLNLWLRPNTSTQSLNFPTSHLSLATQL